jgi:hypothetical protein
LLASLKHSDSTSSREGNIVNALYREAPLGRPAVSRKWIFRLDDGRLVEQADILCGAVEKRLRHLFYRQGVPWNASIVKAFLGPPPSERSAFDLDLQSFAPGRTRPNEDLEPAPRVLACHRHGTEHCLIGRDVPAPLASTTPLDEGDQGGLAAPKPSGVGRPPRLERGTPWRVAGVPAM